MEKLFFTLYEVFGYFLPGAVGVLSVGTLFCAIFLPVTPIPVQNMEPSALWYFGLIALSYYSGHVLQEVSRSLFKNPDSFVLAHQKPDMLPVVKRAQEQIAIYLGMEKTESPSASTTVKLCDELSLQYGQPGDRDVFVYREGFYRGSIASFIFLDIALLFRLIVPGSQLRLSTTHTWDVSRCQLAFLMGLVSCSIFFLAQRYKHFATLRVMRGILAFVSLSSFQSLTAGKAQKTGG